MDQTNLNIVRLHIPGVSNVQPSDPTKKSKKSETSKLRDGAKAELKGKGTNPKRSTDAKRLSLPNLKSQLGGARTHVGGELGTQGKTVTLVGPRHSMQPGLIKFDAKEDFDDKKSLRKENGKGKELATGNESTTEDSNDGRSGNSHGDVRVEKQKKPPLSSSISLSGSLRGGSGKASIRQKNFQPSQSLSTEDEPNVASANSEAKTRKPTTTLTRATSTFRKVQRKQRESVQDFTAWVKGDSNDRSTCIFPHFQAAPVSFKKWSQEFMRDMPEGMTVSPDGTIGGSTKLKRIPDQLNVKLQGAFDSVYKLEFDESEEALKQATLKLAEELKTEKDPLKFMEGAIKIMGVKRKLTDKVTVRDGSVVLMRNRDTHDIHRTQVTMDKHVYKDGRKEQLEECTDALYDYSGKNQKTFSLLMSFVAQDIKTLLSGFLPGKKAGRSLTPGLKPVAGNVETGLFKVTDGAIKHATNSARGTVELRTVTVNKQGHCEFTIDYPIDFRPESTKGVKRYPLGNNEALRIHQVSKFLIDGPMAKAGNLKVLAVDFDVAYSGKFNVK